MRTGMIAIASLILVGCSSDDSPEYRYVVVDAGAGDAACEEVTGAVACGEMLDEVCSRLVQCCQGENCGDWALSVPDCRGEYIKLGYECSSQTVAENSACLDAVDECKKDVWQISCHDVLNGTAYFPPSCDDLWATLTKSP